MKPPWIHMNTQKVPNHHRFTKQQRSNKNVCQTQVDKLEPLPVSGSQVLSRSTSMWWGRQWKTCTSLSHPFYHPSRAPKISKPQCPALQRLLRLLGSDNSAHDAVQGLECRHKWPGMRPSSSIIWSSLTHPWLVMDWQSWRADIIPLISIHSIAKNTNLLASSIFSLKDGKSAHELSRSTTFLASPRSAAPDWMNSFNSGRKDSMLKPGIICTIRPSIHISISCMYSLWIVV